MLNRLLLRLAVVNALTRQPGEPAPTIADETVFDSRLDDIEFDGEHVELPIIIVYTEDDENVLADRGRGFGAFERHVILRLELAIGSFVAATVDGVKQVSYGLPTTDAELEGLLDLFEAQVYRTFMHPVRPASVQLQAMILQLDTWHSTASRSADGNNRLAARTITVRCRIPPDARPAVSTRPIAPSDEVPTFPTAPYLDPLILALSKSDRNAGLMAMLREAAGGGPQVYVPAFQRIGVKASVKPSSDQNLLAVLARAAGQQGPISVVTEWPVGGHHHDRNKSPRG
jgi:hypothetical protein